MALGAHNPHPLPCSPMLFSTFPPTDTPWLHILLLPALPSFLTTAFTGRSPDSHLTDEAERTGQHADCWAWVSPQPQRPPNMQPHCSLPSRLIQQTQSPSKQI